MVRTIVVLILLALLPSALSSDLRAPCSWNAHTLIDLHSASDATFADARKTARFPVQPHVCGCVIQIFDAARSVWPPSCCVPATGRRNPVTASSVATSSYRPQPGFIP
jgi:hypothetical protein